MARNRLIIAARFSFILACSWAGTCSAFAASATPPLLKAKQDAESKGYTFLAARGEIVAGAKKEGKLRVIGSMTSGTYKNMMVAFKKLYPFIDVSVEDLRGTDAHQRTLLELKAGRATDWDLCYVAPDFYGEYLPYIKKLDILGMAMQKVLAIPPAMIDPKNRNIVSIASSIFAIGYNRKLIPEERVPRRWEDFLKPDYKGKKFMVDIRPLGFAALAAGLGEKWAMDYAAKIAAQEPVWVRGQSRSFAAIITGEQAMLHLAYYHSCLRSAKKDVTHSLECKVIEPVPARLDEFDAVSHAAPHPYATLLWLEFAASPEGQSIIDEHEPLNSSIYASDSALARVTKGKKLSVNNWDTLQHTSTWEQMALKAFGFPKADDAKR
ncbi:MAG: ABC transporter substrate-binding protein [Candidatus Binatia bacterium]